MSKIRLTVDVSGEMNIILEQIAKETGSSKSDVFRRAVSLMEISHNARKRGDRVGIAAQDGTLKTEFVGI